jgi:hypothetical protein
MNTSRNAPREAPLICQIYFRSYGPARRCMRGANLSAPFIFSTGAVCRGLMSCMVSTDSGNPEAAVSKEEEAVFPIADMVESELSPERDWIEDHYKPARITLDRITKMTIFGVCGWSLIETPLEIGASNLNNWLLAVAVSKFIVILIGTAAIARVRVARAIFALGCGISVLAIVPALPFVYTQSVEIAVISTVECVLKAACLGALGLSSFQKKLRKRQTGTVDSGIR